MILKTFSRVAITTLLLNSALFLDAVENSIVPAIEKYERIENLQIQKYSDRQYSEIVSSLNRKSEKIRLATYNVLFNLYDHNLDEVNRWPQRLPRIVALFEEMQPDIIGVQELYANQVDDLRTRLEGVYAFYSKPCKDGEHNGIFYRKDRFKVLVSDIWYMTETPRTPSSAGLTMVQLKDRKTGKCIAVFNAHLAFSNVNKRDFQARFIAEQIETFAAGMPHIFMGDLNLFPNRVELQKLPFFDGDYIHRILTAGALRDAKEVAILGHLGPLSTFSNAEDNTIPFQGTGTPGVFLDRIYVSPNINVLIHAVQPGTVDGHFPSDHLPVLIDFTLE